MNERTGENVLKNPIVTLPVHCPTTSITRVWATMKCLEIPSKNIATEQSQPRRFDLKPLNEDRYSFENYSRGRIILGIQ